MAEERAQRRLAAILAADVVGYSRLMEADEAGTLAMLKIRRKKVLDPLVAKHQGRAAIARLITAPSRAHSRSRRTSVAAIQVRSGSPARAYIRDFPDANITPATDTRPRVEAGGSWTAPG